jgi:tetratricopeptide (TPR) repeat protein
MKNILIVLSVILMVGCTSHKKELLTTEKDYDSNLNTKTNPSRDVALEELAFWQERVGKDSMNSIAISKLAGNYATLFSETGNVEYLYTSEKLIEKALQVSARGKDTYLRSLAHNYISQHRFKEAKVLLDSAYTFPDNKRATELMLFDISMELGEYEKAYEYLGLVKNLSDYNYLIRLAKWSDHKGDLDSAIRYMEKAKAIAESGGVNSLIIWTYSNIADFYGHAGRLEDSYRHYLRTLQLQPDNAYAKKGIAWIIYSSEKNTSEANRILDSVMKTHKAPDYFLLKSEMAKFDGNLSEAAKQRQNFIDAVNNGNYGGMYNTYLIKLYAETDPEMALTFAKKEIINRATPETYQLLAYAQLKAGLKEEALITLEKHVVGKTSEPKALYCAALVYKANGMNDWVLPLKELLMEASFELGPVMAKEIENL